MERNKIYAIPSHTDYLEHHGVKGQSWGITNGPPYPLNAAGKSRFHKIRSLFTKDTRDLRAERHEKAKTFNQRMVKANIKKIDTDTEAVKAKVKQQNTKNELRRARHAKRDAERKARQQERLEKEKLKTEIEKQRQARALAKQQTKDLAAKQKLENQRTKEDLAKQRLEQKIAEKRLDKELHPERYDGRNKAQQDVKQHTNLLKQKVINSGDKKLLAKYGKYLTNEEFKEASNRVVMKAALDADAKASRSALRAKKFQNAADTAANTFEKTANTLGKGIDAYNKVASIHNTIKPDKKWARVGVKEEPTNFEKLLSNLKSEMDYNFLTNARKQGWDYSTILELPSSRMRGGNKNSKNSGLSREEIIKILKDAGI
jgi:hypothetical protein